MTTINAKYNGRCFRCSGFIAAGTRCNWDKTAGVCHIVCPDTPTPARTAVKRPVQAVAVTMGVFKKDGRVYVVKPNKDKTRVYAKEIVESPARMTESGLQVDFEARYAPGAVYSLTEADRWNLADAKDFLTKFARCIVCGRHLKAAKSVERSIGPVCAGYFKGSSHVNGCAHHDSAAPQGAAAAATDTAAEDFGVRNEPARVEGTCTKCGEPFSNCTSDYHCKNNRKMAALRAAPLTADEELLMAEIRRMNRESKAWMEANPGSWASGIVDDIAHWRNYGIHSVADFDAMEAAEAEKDRRKASYCMDEVVQPTVAESNAALLDFDPRPDNALTPNEERMAELIEEANAGLL